ncbi:MAG: hypothetical protein HY695_04615 [Deltaproteobacteria bacterium]|nr:hypothetical protein [Deltaproteobacteria bacterium]
MFRLLKMSCFGELPVRWFSQVDPAAAGLHPRYRWSAKALRWGALLAAVRLPRPQHVSVDQPLAVAHWLTKALQSGRTPLLFTFASSAVRLCQAALNAGLDLSGAQFVLMGEPITESRLAVVRKAGAIGWPRYGSIECGPTGYGCLAPEASDDVHLLDDLHAVIQPNSDGNDGGLPANALLISGLRQTAPFIMVNVSMGDQAIIRRRVCHCPLERSGWKTHLHSIRSYEKLTGAGMTFLDRDVIHVLEEVCPPGFEALPQTTSSSKTRRWTEHPGSGSWSIQPLAL